MNVDTFRRSVLGKRKRRNNPNASNRPPKRSDLSMVAEVLKISPNIIKIQLPRRIIKELKALNKKSSRNRWEYAGKIMFNPNTTTSMVRFNNPEQHTSQLRNRISAETFQQLQNSYISYHTHPSADTPNNLKNKNSMSLDSPNRKILATLPSSDDMRAYIGNYPNMQANIISDENGYYVIDLIETNNRTRPNPVDVNRTMEWFRERQFFQRRFRTYGGYEYFDTKLKSWKRAINNEVNPHMKRLFGISIKYYGYGDDPATITLSRT